MPKNGRIKRVMLNVAFTVAAFLLSCIPLAAHLLAKGTASSDAPLHWGASSFVSVLGPAMLWGLQGALAYFFICYSWLVWSMDAADDYGEWS